MTDLSIKVTIAGRQYPLTIKPEEEEAIRKAAKQINSNVEFLEKNYAVRDKQDLLAMSALQYASQIVGERTDTVEDEDLVDEIIQLESKVSDYLNKA